MAFQKTYFGLWAITVSTMALAGCMAHPNAMPSGYTYHHDTYKSPASPLSSKVTATQYKYMDASQAEQFRDAVYALLDRITRRAGMPPKPVYILAPDPMTTFYANIDNDLREGMRHIGYALSDISAGAYVFVYDAKLLTPHDGRVNTGLPNVELTLRIFDSLGENARLLTEESGNYFIQGAEVLHIQQAAYKVLPSQDKITRQAQGTNTSSSALTDFTSTPPPSVSSAPPFSRPVSVSPTPSSNNGPMQAMTIDSNGVSYEEAPIIIDERPSMPRARVSTQIEY